MPADVSVVVPTFARPHEVEGVLSALAAQTLLPGEVVIVDAGPPGDRRTQRVVEGLTGSLPFPIQHVVATGGAAIQRNIGLELARGAYVAFVDDDVRPAPDVLALIAAAFASCSDPSLACIAARLDPFEPRSATRHRFAVYATLRLLRGGPGAYDQRSGHAVPRELDSSGSGLRAVQLVGSGCCVWRRQPFDEGLRFADFFRSHFRLEDFHLCLRLPPPWHIADLGEARFVHHKAAAGRPPAFTYQRHNAINARFVFVDAVPERSAADECRYWVLELLELGGRVVLGTMGRRGGLRGTAGYAAGMWAAWHRWPGVRGRSSPADRSDEI